MQKAPIFFGYFGVVPFILFMLAGLAVETSKQAEALSFLQMSYATMILSFLGGVHWGQALPRGHTQQISFSMIPTIAGFGLMAWAVFMDPYLPLLGAAGLFWIIYFMDSKLMPVEFIPEGYFKYRFRLTSIVTATLLISFTVTVF
jgi:hypothetical protein